MTDMFPGTYIVKLNGISQTADIQDGETVVLSAGVVTVTGTGQDSFFVYDAEENHLGVLKTNEEIELFPGTYTVKLNSTVQTATVQAGEKETLIAGVLTVSGSGNDTFYVYDSEENILSSPKTNEETELFPGAYTVKLNNVSKTADVAAGETTVLEAGALTVSGSGDTSFYVYDSDDNQLGSAETGEELEMFPGTYRVDLNNVSKDGTVTAGETTVVAGGVVSVSGTGQDSFFVYDLDDNQLGFVKTNEEVELFPGTYTVELNSVRQTADVQDGETVVLSAGVVTVTGTGQDSFFVYDAEENQLGVLKTNEEIELFPGNYTVELNSTAQTATVQAGEKETLAAGVVSVSGTGQDSYTLYDSDDNQLGSAETNGEIELFPGTYTAELNSTVQTATVQAGEKEILAAGVVSVSGTGNGSYTVSDSDDNKAIEELNSA